MKRFSVFVALMLCALAGHAKAQTVPMADIANWTPPLVQEIASHGWTLIDDSEQERAWFASIASRNNPNLHELALKVAYKGLSGHASKIDIVRGAFLCGAGGEPPDYLQEPLMFTAMGDGIPMDDGGELPPIAIAPGSILAVAVTKSCKGIQSPIPPVMARAPERSEPTASIAQAPRQSSGPCSKPNAAYPIQAIRQGHQGVVYVTLKVGTNGRPTDVRVLRSSGFPELDAAAMHAMEGAVCNATPGTTMGTPVTFSLQGSM
jgi:protein TonB